MKKKLMAVVLGMTVAASMVCGTAFAEEGAKSTYGDVTANEEYSFEIIVKTYSTDFWRAVVQGAEDEAELLGVKVNCKCAQKGAAFSEWKPHLERCQPHHQ